MSTDLDPDRLLAAAVHQTGLDDFGDPTFRVGLDTFAAAFAQAGPNDIGRAVAEAQVTSALRNRLLIEDWWARHPELDLERIEAPVFIVGISRSGTTALSHLLACDPGNRSLLGWEASEPVPPPQLDTYETDPRFEAAKADEWGLLHELNPALAAMHHDPPDMPVECLVVMTQHFVSLSLSLLFPVPGYTRWVQTVDHTPVYRHHERVLKLLQSGGVRGRWTLKSPEHALALDALAARYPDARFIVTHRDPVACVASTADMGRAFADTFAAPRPAPEHGELWGDILVAMADGIVDYRDRNGDDRFIDVAYSDLRADPVGTVHSIYEALGEDLSPPADEAVRAHAAVAVQHRHGRHEYLADDVGIDPAALNVRFDAYRRRFADHLA